MLRFFTVVSLLGAGAVAGHRSAGDAGQAQAVGEYREDLRVGAVDGTGPEVFGRVVALEVDSRGRIYVLDDLNGRVVVFDSSGAVVRTFGRRGQGPGEFESGRGLAWLSPTELVIVATGRHAVFDTSGKFLRNHRRVSNLTESPFSGSAANGLVCDPSRTADSVAYLVSRGDSIIARFAASRPQPLRVEISPGNTVAPPGAPYVRFQSDCARRGVWKFDGADSVIRFLGFNGDTLRRIAHGFTRRQIPDSSRNASMRRIAQQTGAPLRELERVTPRFGQFFGDAFVTRSGDLWVAGSTPGPAPPGAGTLYTVIAPDGRRSSARLRIGYPLVRPLVVEPYVYGVISGANDVQFVVRHRRQPG